MSQSDSSLLADVLRRLQALEDEKAVHDVLVRYGFAVDSDDADGCADLYADDCVIDIDGRAFMHGRSEARGIVTSPVHQGILPHCAHLIGPFVITIDGDHAIATGYQTVYVNRDDATSVWRQGVGRWELARIDGRWQIIKRTSRHVGHDDAFAVLARGVHGEDG